MVNEPPPHGRPPTYTCANHERRNAQEVPEQGRIGAPHRHVEKQTAAVPDLPGPQQWHASIFGAECVDPKYEAKPSMQHSRAVHCPRGAEAPTVSILAAGASTRRWHALSSQHLRSPRQLRRFHFGISTALSRHFRRVHFGGSVGELRPIPPRSFARGVVFCRRGGGVGQRLVWRARRLVKRVAARAGARAPERLRVGRGDLGRPLGHVVEGT